MSRARLGYVGVGLMGLPMVKRLSSLGYPIGAFDIVPERLDAAKAVGARAAVSASDAARNAEFVLLNLPTAEAVETAVFGENGLASALKSPQLVIDLRQAGDRGPSDRGAPGRRRPLRHRP